MKMQNKKILVFLQAGIGDAIMRLPALEVIIKMVKLLLLLQIIVLVNYY